MSSTTGQPRNRRYIRVSQQRKTKLRRPENSIEHQNVHRRRSSSSSSSSSASICIRVYTSEADFHKPEIYGGRVRVCATEWNVFHCTPYYGGRVRVCATEWNVFHCTPSRGGRSRRAAVDIFRGVLFSVWWDFVFFTSNAHGLLQERGNLASCTSLLVTCEQKYFEESFDILAVLYLKHYQPSTSIVGAQQQYE